MKRRLLELAGVLHRTDLLLEEEEEAGGDEGGDDEGDDEGGDEGGDEGADLFGDTGGDEGGGDEGAGEEGEVEEEKEEEEEEEDPIESISNADIAKYGPGEIEKVIDEEMLKIFDASRTSAVVRGDKSIGFPGMESEEKEVKEVFLHKNSLYKLLFEKAEEHLSVEIDMVKFANDVHHLMTNYETLLDMEGMIYNKARQFIMNEIDEAAAGEFEELLALRHGFDPSEKFGTDEQSAPLAVGATGGGGGGV
jgi:hypothetical protein